MSSSVSVLGAPPTVRKLLGVRATLEEQRIIAAAAELEHRSVSSFVLRAALAAATKTSARPRKSLEEIRAIVGSAQHAFQAANPEGRDILEEFLAERRAEAARE